LKIDDKPQKKSASATSKQPKSAITPTPKKKNQNLGDSGRPKRTVVKPAVRDEEESQTDSEEAIDEDDEWNSDDDPDRLWCICKQKYNNRFMIQCDELKNGFTVVVWV